MKHTPYRACFRLSIKNHDDTFTKNLHARPAAIWLSCFRENGIDYDKVNYFIEPLDEAQIKALLKKWAFGVWPLRTKEKESRSWLYRKHPEDDIIAAIIANPGLLNRPIVEFGDNAVIARPIEKALELIQGGSFAG